MNDDKETRKKLLASAKQEFMEKGYRQASLRNICRNAGVTTGALYFFFKDKDDLFVSLVKEPLQNISTVIYEHFQSESVFAQTGKLLSLDFTDDVESARQIIHQLFCHREEFLLALTKSEGSSLEHMVDSFAAMTQSHYLMLAGALSEYMHKEKPEDSIINWVAHLLIHTFVYAITYIEEEEKALLYMEKAMNFMIYGWLGMFGIDSGVTFGNK